MHEFVALTDDYLYRHPEVFEQLVPFQLEYPCRRQALMPLADTLPYPMPDPRHIMQTTGEHHE
mgnify:CR=1 FL=1